MPIYNTRGRKIDRAKFAAKCIADNFGFRGDGAWTQVFSEVREGQRLNNVTDADFENQSLDAIRAGARIAE